MYPPFTSPLILKAVGAHMTRVFGEEAAAVELHACGVARVMLRLWCVDGPHSRSVLTLPECFNRSCKVLSGWIIQLCPAAGIGIDGGREGGREGASELRRRGPASRQPGQLGPGPAAVEVITAYLLTWRWKRCQPLSHRVAVRAVVFERVPITQASPDY